MLLTEADKRKIASTLFAWQSPEWETLYHDIPEFCYSATMDEIRSKDWSLVPSKYIEFVNRDRAIDFQKEMKHIQAEMQDIMAEEHRSQGVLRAAFEGIGYGIE